jgi:hypothetical protein
MLILLECVNKRFGNFWINYKLVNENSIGLNSYY